MALRGTLTHWKTRKLAADLSISPAHALGLLEALWHATAEDAPSGNIGRLSNEAIAMQMFTDIEPNRLIKALIASRHLDEHAEHRLLIHDWHEHADYNTKRKVSRYGGSMFTVNGDVPPIVKRDASSSVDDRLPEPEPEPEPDLGLSPLSPRPEDFANAWNRRRGPLPRVEKFTDGRKRKVRARIRDGLTIDRFIEAVENCRAKPFLSGVNDRGWVATFDWLIANAENVEKAISNPYGLNAGGERGADRPSATKQRVDANVAAIDKALARRGVAGVGNPGGADGAAIPAPGPDGNTRRIPDGLRSAGVEVLDQARERNAVAAGFDDLAS